MGGEGPQRLVKAQQDSTYSRLARMHEALGACNSGIQFCIYKRFQFCALFRRQHSTTAKKLLHTAVQYCREVHIRLKTLDKHCRQ
jgi:hypothetical protein